MATLSPARNAALAAMVLTAGCQTGGQPQPGETAAVRHLALTSAQMAVVQDGVKQMVANPDAAELSSTTAVAAPGEAGIHVCGYVKVTDEAGRSGEALPYYLELRDTSGKSVAERGQVGLDPAKLSKVTFMCRRNGPG